MKEIDGQKLIRSSIWMNSSPATKIVWITMLFEADPKTGIIEGSPAWLAMRANVTLTELGTAIRELIEMDDCNEDQPLKEIKGGWQIHNPQQYI